jgi:hypothetical protein
VVTHEARSHLRLYRDAAGCESVQTVNRQFRLATVVGDRGPERLALEESYDIRHCLTKESSSSEATVTAWRPGSDAASPVFRITGRGVAGAPYGNLYRMTRSGCCGSGDLAAYYSLLTGSYLFSSSVEPRSIQVANTRAVRYFAFHDSFSAAAPAEWETDSTVIGVLTWGDDETPAQRLVVLLDQPEPFATSSLRLIVAGKPIDQPSLTVFADNPVGPIQLDVELVAPGSGRRVSLRIPIVELEPVIDQATLPTDAKLERRR